MNIVSIIHQHLASGNKVSINLFLVHVLAIDGIIDVDQATYQYTPINDEFNFQLSYVDECTVNIFNAITNQVKEQYNLAISIVSSYKYRDKVVFQLLSDTSNKSFGTLVCCPIQSFRERKRQMLVSLMSSMIMIMILDL